MPQEALKEFPCPKETGSKRLYTVCSLLTQLRSTTCDDGCKWIQKNPAWIVFKSWMMLLYIDLIVLISFDMSVSSQKPFRAIFKCKHYRKAHITAYGKKMKSPLAWSTQVPSTWCMVASPPTWNYVAPDFWPKFMRGYHEIQAHKLIGLPIRIDMFDLC